MKLLSAKDIARLIDISAVQTPHGETEIRQMVQSAKKHSFIAVHCLPCWTTLLRDLLRDRPDILVGGPVGFPSGAHTTETKLLEARQLVADGVQEMDLMINVGMLRSGRYDYVQSEISRVVEQAAPVPVKVILEVHYLNEDQVKKACEICIDARAAFVKTATGWAPGGATLENVRLITSFVGNAIKVKASGGIRDLDTLVDMHRMGVSRFGINLDASVRILKDCAARPGGVVEV